MSNGDINIVETEIIYDSQNIENQFTDEEILDTCCKEVDPFPPCVETGMVAEWGGDNELQDYWPESSKQFIQLAEDSPFYDVVFEPRTTPCGIFETQYEILTCCDEVPQIEIDLDNSVEVIDVDDNGRVYTNNTRPQAAAGIYQWTINGVGFSFSPSAVVSKASTDGPSVTVYTLPTACGMGELTVTDGCSEDSYEIKCTEGIYGVGCFAYVFRDYGMATTYGQTNMLELYPDCRPHNYNDGTGFWNNLASSGWRYSRWRSWRWTGFSWAAYYSDSTGLKPVKRLDNAGQPTNFTLAMWEALKADRFSDDPDINPNDIGVDPADSVCGSCRWGCP